MNQYLLFMSQYKEITLSTEINYSLLYQKNLWPLIGPKHVISKGFVVIQKHTLD